MGSQPSVSNQIRMTGLSCALLVLLATVASSAPTELDLGEDLDQLLERFMFDEYSDDYSEYGLGNHYEDETPEEHQRHTTTVRPTEAAEEDSAAEAEESEGAEAEGA